MLKSLRSFKEVYLQGKGESLLSILFQKDAEKWSDAYLQYLKSNNLPIQCVKDHRRFLSTKLWSHIYGPEMVQSRL